MVAKNRPPKQKLSDAERHKRFVDLAKEVEASDDPKEFDKAFGRVTKRAKPIRRP